MRRIAVATLWCLLCGMSRPGLADETSDCLTRCALERRAVDMYCPPAGGYSDDDHRQCREKNSAAYNQCSKACTPAPVSPPVVPPPAAGEEPPAAAGQPAEAEQPAASQDEAAPAE